MVELKIVFDSGADFVCESDPSKANDILIQFASFLANGAEPRDRFLLDGKGASVVLDFRKVAGIYRA